MTEQHDLMEQITRVQARYAESLMSLPHVVGVAVGLAQKNGAYTEELALVVLVDEKVSLQALAPNEVIPAELDGVRVDVQQTGPLEAY